MGADPMSYLMDSLFRNSGSGVLTATNGNSTANANVNVNAPSTSVTSTAEITRIFLNSIKQGALPAEDAKYVSAAVAQRAGLSPDEAEARVKSVYERLQTKLREAETSAKQAADATRKATAYGALWLFVSLLIGAFCASWAATLGGRHRDF